MHNALRQGLSAGHFIYSAELVLGRDHQLPEVETFVATAGRAQGPLRIISLTDLPGGNPALPPEAFLSYVLDQGLTPIAHLSGKDGNRNFLEGRLHSLARMNVENALALTGDAPKEGFDGGLAKAVYDLDSVLLLQLIETLRLGLSHQVGSKTRQTTPFDFFAGAVVSPYKVREPDQMMQYYKLELKIACGARFIITQLGFNLRKLYELKQYLQRVGLADVPVIPSVYVATATIARMMQRGEIPGCIVTDRLIERLQKEKKPQRLERAALMVAAVRELGFAGAHMGGFGLTYKNMLWIIERSEAIGSRWRDRLDELVFDKPEDFYLFPSGPDGFSDGRAPYQMGQTGNHLPWRQRLYQLINRLMVVENTPLARFFRSRLHLPSEPLSDKGWRRGFWYRLLGTARLFKAGTLGCVGCGDCIQDHLLYAGCTMGRCYKELRNGPCGGSRPDGTCEVDPHQPCIWDLVYLSVLAVRQDPHRFANTLLPPHNWALHRTASLANRLVGIDNYPQRRAVSLPQASDQQKTG